MANLKTLKDLEKDVFSEEVKKFLSLFPNFRTKLELQPALTEKRLLEFLKTHDVTLDEVINATKLYIANTQVKYIKRPYYFIKKKVDGVWTSSLEEWIAKYRELNKKQEDKVHITNKLQ